MRSRWLVSLAGMELQVLRGCGLGGVAGWNPGELGWPGRPHAGGAVRLRLRSR
ncbi:MAG: hypothetical protein ACYDHX_04045 [Methanothrix sp.]